MYDTIIERETTDLSALDSIFGTGAKDVITATDTKSLENNTIDTVLNKAQEKKDEIKEPELIVEKPTIEKVELNSILDKAAVELNAEPETPEQIEEKAKGRPSTDKSALVSYLKLKIEANDFGLPADAPFDTKKQTLDAYLGALPEKELHTLLDTNWQAKEDALRAETPKEFYDSLPEELQYAAAYVAEGGQDLKGLFKALSHVEEIKALDPAKEDDQVTIARNYLQTTRFGTADQINEQIEDWKNADKIEKKAKEFKPMLDEMQKEQVIAYQKTQQEQNKREQQLADFYASNVYKQLETNELAGVKLDKKFARELGDSMTTTVPGPWSGRPVNYLGYGLEKAQYTEPDYEAVMLAGWILNNKAEALAAIRVQGANVEAEKTRKLIKMNQGLGVSDEVAVTEQVKVKRLPNLRNSLKRTA